MKKSIFIASLFAGFIVSFSARGGAQVDPVTKSNVQRFWGVAEDQITVKYDYARRIKQTPKAPVPLVRQKPQPACQPKSHTCSHQQRNMYVHARPAVKAGPRVDAEEASQAKNRRRKIGFNLFGDFNLFNISMDDESKEDRASLRGNM